MLGDSVGFVALVLFTFGVAVDPLNQLPLFYLIGGGLRRIAFTKNRQFFAAQRVGAGAAVQIDPYKVAATALTILLNHVLPFTFLMR